MVSLQAGHVQLLSVFDGAVFNECSNTMMAVPQIYMSCFLHEHELAIQLGLVAGPLTV